MKTNNIYGTAFKPVTIILILITSAVLFSGCSLFSRRYEKKETKEYKVRVDNKKKIQLDNLNGDITIKKNTFDSSLIIRAEITSWVRKRDLDEPLDNVKIIIDSTESTIRVSSEMTSVSRHIRFFSFHSDNINYDIEVPDGLEITVDNTNGKISMEKMNNDVSVTNVNGRVKFKELTGKLSFDITNGKINGELDSTKGITINSVNGDITLSLADTFAGKIDAETVNGKINTKDFNFINTEQERGSFKGELGQGGPEVKIDVVNGKIKFVKKSGATEGSRK